MVTWTGDGTMAGYDPVTKRLKKGLFHFASPGSVDLQGNTRLNFSMGAGLSTTTYPNSLQITAPLRFSAADFTANPGKKLGVGFLLIRSDKFPEGHVPTPQELWDKAAAGQFDFAERATTYWNPPGPTPSFTFDIGGEGSGGFYWNTKWWAMIYPSAITNPNTSWSKTNDAPIKGSNINSVARVLSFWGNRTPGKPTITSPLTGTQVNPGAEFTLRLNPADPDEQSPEDAPKYNDDVNGIHFQYRPVPTAEVPNPDWEDLPFDWHYAPGDFDQRSGAWMIRGSRYYNGLAGLPEYEALIANLGCSVVAGADEKHQSPGKGALPTGDWQIRGRTFDYGHPYPNSGTVVTEPGPLGINPATNYIIEPAKDTYPEQNRSPWSDPITVSIPSQVPPPLAVSPKDAVAVSGDSVRLRWQYRNTHVPPRDQYMRDVQIRKVGDPDWSLIFSGVGSDPYVDLPRHLTQTIPPPIEALTDGTFEAGTLNWLASGSLVPTVATNVNNAAQAHSGNRFLKLTNPVMARPNNYTDDFNTYFNPSGTPETYITGLPVEYTSYEADGWFYVDATNPVQVLVQGIWVDADGLGIYSDDVDALYSTPYVMFFVSKFFTGPAQWRKFSDLTPDVGFNDYYFGSVLGGDPSRRTIQRPPNGVALAFFITVTTNDGSNLNNLLTEVRFDDLHLIGSPPALNDFDLNDAAQYEWNVKVADTDGIVSGNSTPARFWMIPAAGEGEVVPVPSDTIEGAELGIGTHRIEVFRRGGKRYVGEIRNVSHVDYNRVRDDISIAKIEVSGWDIDGGNLLAMLQTWAYEVVIWRDNGYSVDRVWEGPITLLTYEVDKVTISAKDVMGYAYRRIIKQKMTDSGTGNGTTVVDRARRVLQNAFAPDDPNVLAYLQILARDDDAMQYRSTPAYSRTAFEEVDDMAANAGLDYTTIGRSIMLWGTKHRIGTLPELRDENLGASPIVSEYGMSMANRYAVSDGNGVYGEATRLDADGNDETYGLVEMLSSTWASDSESDTGTYTQEGLATVQQSFRDFAERSIADRYPPPVVVRIPDNTSLNPNTVLSIQHLVPGVAIPLRSTGTLREVVGTQKLDQVKVVEEGGKETITITLSPFSRDDVVIGEGDDV